jgi:peroxiredoxin
MSRRIVLSLAVAALAALVAGSAVAAEIEIGEKGPAFQAKGVDGKEYSLASTKGAKATVLCFTCNQCPVAVAYEDRFIEFQKKYGDKGVKFIAINVNTSEDLAAMKERAEEKGFNFPYAYDESGDAARAYGARVTPHLFLLDDKGVVVYRGSFDDKQNNPKTPHLENAVNAVLAGETPGVASTNAFGCGIKPKKK